MADKPGRFEGLVVNFQNLPPKSGDPLWKVWVKLMVFGLVFFGSLRLLALFF